MSPKSLLMETSRTDLPLTHSKNFKLEDVEPFVSFLAKFIASSRNKVLLSIKKKD
jgi:hypothetical protein